ncbi:hypothetical protein RclHR1_10370008 [Rhizophagus clarus]|uniref:Uncharacterized protein n=1 Tax=Rhizophagus clarus TaxID=94130 RepID=A0A2Z6QFW4_9GLOM|nr:hypothetical protein RclHR1_10370008 [Rhizophagus clarus]
MNKRKRKRADNDFNYLYGIVTSVRDWHLFLYNPGEISQASEFPFTIKFNKKVLDKDSEKYDILCKEMLKVLGIICTKQVLPIMSNAQSIDSLREVNARLLVEISELKKKFAEVKTENAKLKQIIEKNTRRDARVDELEQKNMELEHRLMIVKLGFSVVDDQLHKEVISKRFVEQTVSDVDLSSSVTNQ